MSFPASSFPSPWGVLSALAGIAFAAPAWSEELLPPEPGHPGAAIYQKLCLECHGERGEGVPDLADDPLHGTRDLASLAGRIARTMPEDDPHLCAGEEAEQVAEYIYRAFYSVEARLRDQPARVELARLTVPQFRNSIADLVGTFRGGHAQPAPEERGLTARYFASRNFNAQKDKEGRDQHQQVDPAVSFDFGEDPPAVPEDKEFGAEEFSVRWEGMLLAEETGSHEFVIRTRNGAALFVNERDDHRTIDAWVASDNETREEKRSVYLLGGRAYPIRLDFYTFKEKGASIELLWKPPGGVLEVIPTRNLAPASLPETLVIAAPFPADDRSAGYERGTAVSKQWLDAAAAAASETAEYVTAHLNQLARTRAEDEDREAKIRDFAVRFLEAAFRRPLADEEREQWVGQRFAETESLELAVRRLVLLAVTSPRFLFPAANESDPPDDWTVASRLALTLWDSLPDPALAEAARKGKLNTREQIESAARRMLGDARARAKAREFFHHWLELERAEELAKDAEVYPDFSEQILADLRASLFLFIDEVAWGESSDYRELILSDALYLNERLAPLYGLGAGLPEGEGFHRVEADRGKHAGIITHPYLLAAHAYHNNTSPIHRGVFLSRNIVGMTLNSPPEANLFEDSSFDPHMTMREKVAEMTRSASCMSCHAIINPLGFGLEHFDGIGRWRDIDNGKPVDASSELKTDSGKTVALAGGRDIAEFAVTYPAARRAFIQQLFHHAVKQPVAAYGTRRMDDLEQEFEASGFSIRRLLENIAVTAATEGLSADASVASN